MVSISWKKSPIRDSRVYEAVSETKRGRNPKVNSSKFHPQFLPRLRTLVCMLSTPWPVRRSSADRVLILMILELLDHP